MAEKTWRFTHSPESIQDSYKKMCGEKFWLLEIMHVLFCMYSFVILYQLWPTTGIKDP